MKTHTLRTKLPKRAVLIFAVLLVVVPVIIFPDRYVESVSVGLELYAIKVLPALFPFFFFSKILSELNFGHDLGSLMKKPLKKLYNAPPVAGYVMVMSMLCGYPIGAKLLSDYYEAGYIDEKTAKSVAAFTSNSGPLFIVGTVGVGILNDKTAGFIILISHYLSSFICGLIFRGKACEKTEPRIPEVSYDKILSESMTGAIINVLIVGGYVAIFYMVSDMLSDVGLIKILSFALSFVGVDIRLGNGIFTGLIEITKGSLLLSKTGLAAKIVVPTIALIITFGGLSVTLQSMTYLNKCKISPFFYLLFKSVQGILAFLICLALCAIFY